MSEEIRPGSGMTAENVLMRVISTLAAKRRRQRRNRIPLWSMVGEITCHGSGYSASICIWAGFNSETGEPLSEEGKG